MAQSPSQVFDSAAYYRIVWYGALNRDWTEWLEGMEAGVIPSGDGGCNTVLSGWLRDQAALVGVLETAYNLGIPLLSVQRLDVDASG